MSSLTPTSTNRRTRQPAPISASGPTLQINHADDQFEQEANVMADHVVNGKGTAPGNMTALSTAAPMAMPQREDEEKLQMKRKGTNQTGTMTVPTISRMTSRGGQHQAQTAPTDFTQSLRNSNAPGQALPTQTAQEMGGKIGADFSGVRIHTGQQAQQLSENIGAKAFTHGNDIYFNQGEYNPQSKTGKHLLAHELTHTVQQNAGLSAIQRTGLDQVPKNDRASMDIDTGKFKLYDKPDVIFDPANSATRKLVGSTPDFDNKVLNSIIYVNIPKKLEFGFRNLASNFMGGGAKANMKGQQTGGTAPDSGETRTMILKFKDYPKLQEKWKVDPKAPDKDQQAALTEVSANRAYRFTTYGSGATQKILIEGLGTAEVETAAQGVAGKKMVDTYKLTFVNKAAATKQRDVASKPHENIKDWTAGEKKRVTTAMGILPDAIMKKFANLKIHRVDKPESQHIGTGGKWTTQADYTWGTHTLTLYDDAFAENLNIFGEGPGAFVSSLQNTVVHELGHAIDFTPYRDASAKGDKLFKEEEKQFTLGNDARNNYASTALKKSRQDQLDAANGLSKLITSTYNSNLSSKSPEHDQLLKLRGSKQKGAVGDRLINFLKLSEPADEAEFKARLKTFEGYKDIDVSKVIAAMKDVLNKHKIVVIDTAFHQAISDYYDKGGTVPAIPPEVDQKAAQKAVAAIQLTRNAIDARAAHKKDRLDNVKSESGYGQSLTGPADAQSWSRDKSESLKAGQSNAFRDAAKKDFQTSAINRVTDYADESWAEMWAESFSYYFTDNARFKLLRPNLWQFFFDKFGPV